MFNLNNLLPSKMKSTNDSRKRFRISAFQVQSLEDVFKNNPRPCKEIQEEVAAQLNLPYRTVTIWFQNRRAKAKLIGEPIADHVFQWKPPVVATKSPSNLSLIKSSEGGSIKHEPHDNSQPNSPNETSHGNQHDTSLEQDSANGQSSGASNIFTKPNPIVSQSNFDPRMQNNWGAESFNGAGWMQKQPSLPQNSMDSASFISDFTNYEGCNFQMEFDSFLATQNNMDVQMGLTSQGVASNLEGFSAQQILAYPAGIFTPPLSHSVISLSTQGTGSSGFYNDVSNNANLNTMQNGFYSHPNDMSVQSLPHFSGNTSIPHSIVMASSLGLQHPTLSAPELAFRNGQLQPNPQARTAIQLKMEQERNNAMFFSMRS